MRRTARITGGAFVLLNGAVLDWFAEILNLRERTSAVMTTADGINDRNQKTCFDKRQIPVLAPGDLDAAQRGFYDSLVENEIAGTISPPVQVRLKPLFQTDPEAGVDGCCRSGIWHDSSDRGGNRV